ncbi:diguanylate cyclase/phosphodiesterase [Acidimicrobium ferrooxidans DSM 10331]|uniref:Diguanylate cyclase/phosphodiesterase n=1 Tax=Acidimicrobium ferrooxidans (strain DSM 10331 / JCM 15462 / NBRC 103882 / ICP) TaxID=525909 RepID=C7LYF8_ACIFD|nr:EAL domain-containing protein [Acidimicrobium ferrooxidans]ACU53766.1 diguanylate cyclase/phosphodiesterase [Acidimicrobium ferrooxidans DSM 10331]
MSVVDPALERPSAVLELVLQAFQAQRVLRRADGRSFEERLADALETLCVPPTLAGFWARLDPGEHHATILATSGTAKAYCADLELSDDPTSLSGQGPAGTTLRSLSPVVATVDDAIFAPWRERARPFGIEGSLSAAAACDDGTRYLLSLYRSDLARLPPETALVLDALAQAAAELHQEQRRARARELEAATDRLVAWLRSTTDQPPESTILELARHLAELPGVGAVDALATSDGERRFERLATYGTMRSVVGLLPEPRTDGTQLTIPDLARDARRCYVVRRPASHLELPDHWRAEPRLRQVPLAVAIPLVLADEVRAVLVALVEPGAPDPERIAALLEQIGRTATEALETAAGFAERVALAALFDALATGSDRLLACRTETELADVTTKSLVDTGVFDLAALVAGSTTLGLSRSSERDLAAPCRTALSRLCERVRREGHSGQVRLSPRPVRWAEARAGAEDWLFATPVPDATDLVLCARAVRSPVSGNRELLLLERVAASLAAQRARIRLEATLRAERDAQRTVALRDALTGLPNRRAFLEEAEARCRRVEEDGVGLALGILDLDGFKEWNDVYRHSEGDRILAEVGASLAALPPELYVARLGGDEFGLLARLDSMDLGTLSQAVHAAAAVPTPGGPLSASLGWALWGPVGVDVETLLAHADEAMYHAKSQGGGRTRIFEDEMARLADRRHRLRTKLASAIGTDQVRFWYQPQVDLVAGRLAGVELLARWYDGAEVVPADAFMDVVERDAYLARRLDLDALEHACTLLAERPSLPAVAVNIAARHLLTPTFAADVARVIRTASTERLVLEITEAHSLGDDLASAVSRLEAIRALGARIAIDDFGRGWASMAYVHSLPIDQLKVDRSLVASLATDPRSFASSLSALALGSYAGVEVVGEGIETTEDLAMWRAIGGRFVQGYGLGRPQPTVPTRLRSGARALLASIAPFPLDDLPLLASLVAARAGRPLAHQRDERCPIASWLRQREGRYGDLASFEELAEVHEHQCGRADEPVGLKELLERLVAAITAERTNPARRSGARRERGGRHTPAASGLASGRSSSDDAR